MDCLIIGAGLIGSSIAWRLSQRGRTVTLVDSGRYFGQSSHAGAGMLLPVGESFPSALWASRARESFDAYPDFVRELETLTGLTIDYRRTASVEATVDPRDLAKALRIVLEKNGVLIEENSMLRSSARTTVVAAGAWSSSIKIEGVNLPLVEPVKGYLLGYDCPPGSLGVILHDGPTYILQRKNGFTIAGSTEERIGFDMTMNPALIEGLRSRAEALWPPLRHSKLTETWFGFRPASDGIQVRRVPERSVWLAYGHYRNGILLAPWTADRVAGEIDEFLGASEYFRR